MLAGHGTDIYRYENEIVVDFSSNIAKVNIREKLLAFLQKKLKTISNYPDPEMTHLKRAVAKFHNISTDEVIITNGSTEAFYLVAHTFPKRKTFIKIPSFAEYEDACSRYEHTLFFETQIDTETIRGFDMVWLGNPNNPDGKVESLENISDWSKHYPNTTFVIDEAYADLSQVHKTAIPLVLKKQNVIIIRSLTKSFSIPGLRIGYIVCKREIAEKIRNYTIPWNINSLAVDAGVFIMNNYSSLVPDAKELAETCANFKVELEKNNNLKVYHSDCNFLLVQLLRGNASDLKQYLVKHHGLLVRDASNFRGLGPQYFRVAVRSNQQNQLLANAIIDWMTH